MNRDHHSSETSPSTRDDGEPFLRRWARRKRRTPFSPETEDRRLEHPKEDVSRETETETAHGDQPRELPEDLAGIDPDTADPTTLDHARLMRDDVPEDFRRRALRRLWEADDTLANLDGLNDYDEDFTPAGIAAAATAFFTRLARDVATTRAAPSAESSPAQSAVAEPAASRDNAPTTGATEASTPVAPEDEPTTTDPNSPRSSRG